MSDVKSKTLAERRGATLLPPQANNDGEFLQTDGQDVSWQANGSGTVTNVATGTGLTGGPITTTGTVSLADTAVTPGSYTSADITVDAQGRITAAASGTSGVSANLSNLTPTSINESLNPDSDVSLDLGAPSTRWDTLYASNVKTSADTASIDFDGRALIDSSELHAVDWADSDLKVRKNLVLGPQGRTITTLTPDAGGGHLTITTNDAATPGTSPGNTVIQPGVYPFVDASAIGGGSITIQTGTSNSTNAVGGQLILRTGSGGAGQGSVQFQNGTEGTVGHVWTSIDTSGTGEWAAITAANQTLSNLTGPTALNEDLNFSGGTYSQVSHANNTDANASGMDAIIGTTNSLALLTESQTDTSTGSTSINIASGAITNASSTAGSGYVYIFSGDVAGSGSPEAVYIVGGSATNGANTNAGGNIELSAGSTVGSGAGGDIHLYPGTSGSGTDGRLHVHGIGQNYAAMIFPVRRVTGTTTLNPDVDYKIVFDDNTAGSWNLNLPPGIDGLSFRFSYSQANTGAWTAIPAGTESIDTALSNALGGGSGSLGMVYVASTDTWYVG